MIVGFVVTNFEIGEVPPKNTWGANIASCRETQTSEVKKLSSQPRVHPRLLIKIKIVSRHETKKSEERLYDIKST